MKLKTIDTNNFEFSENNFIDMAKIGKQIQDMFLSLPKIKTSEKAASSKKTSLNEIYRQMKVYF